MTYDDQAPLNIEKPTFIHNRTTIIIPCYNEANRLHLEVFLNFARLNPNISFVFVDDGSKDLTINLLCGAMAALPNQIDVLMMSRNAGKAEAVRHGLKFAAKRGDKYVGFLDADLATPLYAIKDFVSVADRLDNIDVVFGSRSGGLGHRVYREFHRKIISLVCATMGRMATGLALKDTQCGAKLFRNTDHLRKCLDVPFTTGWLFDVELFLRISNPDKKTRKNFFEYPVLEWTEIPGSNIKLSDVIKGGISMTSLILNQWKIRALFQENRKQVPKSASQILRSGESLTLQSLKSMEALVDIEKVFIILDFSKVKSLGPSVFSTLTEICEKINLQGKQLYIYLPDNDDILSAARRSSLTALFDCSIRNITPKSFQGNSRLSLVAT